MGIVAIITAGVVLVALILAIRSNQEDARSHEFNLENLKHKAPATNLEDAKRIAALEAEVAQLRHEVSVHEQYMFRILK